MIIDHQRPPTRAPAEGRPKQSADRTDLLLGALLPPRVDPGPLDAPGPPDAPCCLAPFLAPRPAPGPHLSSYVLVFAFSGEVSGWVCACCSHLLGVVEHVVNALYVRLCENV